MSRNQHIRAIRRRRRQTSFQIFGTRLYSLLEPRRKCAALLKLSFQPRRQAVLLGKPRREIALMARIPCADNLTVLIPVIAVSLVVILSLFVVTLPLSLTLSVALGQYAIPAEHKGYKCARAYPSRYFHCLLRTVAGIF